MNTQNTATKLIGNVLLTKRILVLTLLIGLTACKYMNTNTPTAITVAPYPTMLPDQTPVVTEINGMTNCNAPGYMGHIFFLQQEVGGDRHPSSRYNLLVMNGNGCYPRLIMKNVSGSPAWSRDWKTMAIGCDNNTSLCIIDVTMTLKACIGLENEIGHCNPVVQDKYSLPTEIANENDLYNIAWSPNGSQIVLDGQNFATHSYKVYILTLADEGNWKILAERNWIFKVDWSPISSQIAFSGLYLIEPDGGRITSIASGDNPTWSPDGKSLAYLTAYEKDLKLQAIVSLDLEEQQKHWLWIQKNRNDSFPMLEGATITDGGADHRLLSWSPDADYIAFVSLHQHIYDSQIFRLDTATGRVEVLTDNFMPKEGDPYYFAPAWGP